MLEIIVITIVLLAVFIAVAWYGHLRSKKMAKLLDLDDDYAGDSDDDESYSGESFDALYEQELKQRDTEQQPRDINSEPTVTLSSSASTLTEAESVARSNIPTPDKVTATQTEMSLNITQEHDWEMVISFTIMAMQDEQFSGKAIKSTLETLDMHFGDMQLYHRYTHGIQKQSLFSVANIIDPGTLLPDSLATMTTPGLLIFARLPGPMNGLALFDDLLEAAQKMAATLGGVLSDDQREPITDSRLEEMRSRIFNLNLTLQAESTSNG